MTPEDKLTPDNLNETTDRFMADEAPSPRKPNSILFTKFMNRFAPHLRAPRLLGWILRRLPAQRRKGGTFHLLLAPPGGGNIGDQALVEAFAGGVAGPVTIVVKNADAFQGLDRFEGVSLLELPNLMRGPFPLNLRDALRLRRLWGDARSFSVIGADVMDGAYDWRASVIRATLAAQAARDSLDTRILGFSWNESPNRHAEIELRRSARAGVRLLARDTASKERLEQLTPQVELTADIVFTDDRKQKLPGDISTQLDSVRYAIINASGLVGKMVQQTPEYVRVVEMLAIAGFKVILLPHVIRSSGDDLAACRAISLAIPDNLRGQVALVDELLSPGQVRQLVAGAELVVTGRMHLGVIALAQNVPPIVISTQGKVEGLMSMFDAKRFAVSPSDIPNGGITRAVEDLRRNLPELRDTIALSLPRVAELAARNLTGLQ